MKPDDDGRFGFNVKGGHDQNCPILVSRVAPNTPADNASPKLREGDQVMTINGKDVNGLTHDQVICFYLSLFVFFYFVVICFDLSLSTTLSTTLSTSLSLSLSSIISMFVQVLKSF